ISNTKTPQDGRIKITARQKDYDLRASTLPSIFGEKIVMRILDKSGLSLDLPKLGIDTRLMDNVVACIKRPTGMCLVTGPTGSGKTTTLYSFLNHVNDIESNIVTVEDPVEYQLKGINQVQINPKSGLTFASALRSILRQDPDIVMVGEIRDHETAEIAVHAAQTGHLVFSTLHTNDAPSTISRLLDIGIDPPTLAASLSMILAQRLARKLCPECKVRAEITHTMKTIYGFPDDVEFYAPNPKGCPKCHGIGYKGRLGIHEIIIINDRIRELVARGAGVREITMIAREEGMMTLFEDGINKMLQGVTSFEEVLRISVPPEDFHLSGRISADGERLLGINEFDHSKKNVDINESEVLIVDKSIEVSESISAVLQSKGFNVNIARDGEQAMDKLRHCNPLFLICDLNSEKIGGLEIIKRIRANKTLNSMRIIVISDN
ncbi:MAG: type II/IV secretion system protein, partial [Methanobacteriota archaeon]